ncbi:nitroreductase family protein [Paenibacillus tarimensis]
MRAQVKTTLLKIITDEQLDSIMVNVEQLQLKMRYLLALTFSKSKLLTSIYYVFSGEFKREQYAVIHGKVIHLSDLLKKRNNDYLLRRNTHRIEKGLLMRPRRAVFGTRFISETMNSFVYLIEQNKNTICNSQLKWSHDVLSEYFEVTGDHPIINQERERFKRLDIKHILNPGEKYIPYKRDLSKQNVITLEQLKELSLIRRSVRWFTNAVVPRELIDKALEVATLAPSACNRQPFRFQIFDDPNIVRKLAKIPSGTAGFHQNIPTLVAVIGDLTAYPYERDRHLIYIDASLAVMPFLYALEVQGLSSCPLNWPDIEEKERKLEQIIRTKKHERVIMFIAVGFPDENAEVAYSRKKDLAQLRSYNL